VGGSHWLLLIPFYFFSALASLLVLVLVSRATRLRASISTLATAAVVLGLAFASVPILTGWLQLADYTVGRMFILVAFTGVLTLVDTLLRPSLPLPLDKELQEL